VTYDHPKKNVEERFQVMSVGVWPAFQNFNGHEFHSSSSMSGSTWAAIKLFPEIQIDESASWILLLLWIRYDGVVVRNIPMKYLSIMVEGPMRFNKIATCFEKLFN
jgi:hypothetical protein